MNKISAIVLLVSLVLSGSKVFAQGTASDSNTNAVYAQRMMQARNAAAGSPMGMNPLVSKEKIEKFMQSLMEMGLLYKMLEQPTMVSTDGGIIVAYGNTLRKYDKDLNVVKEVDLDVNVDGMQELASKFAKKYSSDIMDLMGGATGPSSASSSVSPGASTSTAASSKSLEDQKEEEIKKEIDQIK